MPFRSQKSAFFDWHETSLEFINSRLSLITKL